jgi:hypothetical protein
MSEPIPLYRELSFSVPHPWRWEWDPVFISSGSNFEAGVKWKQAELYAAYRKSDSREISDSRYLWDSDSHRNLIWRKRDWWSEWGLSVGARYVVVPQTKVVSALIGMGLEWGRSAYRFHEEEGEHVYVMDIDSTGNWYVVNDYEHTFFANDHVWKSSQTYGVVIEFGAALRPVNWSEILIISQIHSSVAHFGDDFIGNPIDIRYVLTPTLQLQLRYVFR